MDMTNILLNLLLSMAVTAFAYLIVPIIIAKSDRKYSKKTLRKIVTINAACVFTFFFILRIALAGKISLNPIPALLWSGIGFYILKRTSDIDSDYDDEGTLIRCKSCGYIGSYAHECPQCGRYEKEYVEQKDVQEKND